MPTQEQWDAIARWELKLNEQGIFFEPGCAGNIGLILGYITNNLRGELTETNLEIARKACHAALRFAPGYEAPDPRADVKAKAKADAEELDKKRKRDAAVKAGIGPNQSKLKTEFDRNEQANKPKLADGSDELARMALTDLTNDAFMREANDIIAKHRGPTHGRTAAQQEVLCKERDRLIKANATPIQVRDGVRKKQNSFYEFVAPKVKR